MAWIVIRLVFVIKKNKAYNFLIVSFIFFYTVIDLFQKTLKMAKR